MMRLAYALVLYLLMPIILVLLMLRGIRNRQYWKNIGQRFGYAPLVSQQTIWVHAVSMGEVHAIAPLIECLLSDYPNTPLLLTTVTPSGAERVNKLFGDRVIHCYVPYDLPGAVRRFFSRIHPRLAIIVETELWPNLYHECGRRKVPLVLASARISPRSVARYRKFLPLFSEALSHGIVIAAQSEADAERFKLLGANPRRTHVVGNIKFDLNIPDVLVAQGKKLRASQFPNRPIWIAASTHEGEENLLIEAWRKIREIHPNHLWILVPRHPERFARVLELLRAGGLRVVTRTSKEPVSAQTDVFLVDTIGELMIFYACADIAFVGGSLVPIGGHNLLEPAALGLPLLIGPHNFNAADIAGKLLACDAAVSVKDVASLVSGITTLLSDPNLREKMGRNGLAAIKRDSGALELLRQLLGPLLERGLEAADQVNVYSSSH